MKKLMLLLACICIGVTSYGQQMMFPTNISAIVYKRDMTKLYDRIINVDLSNNHIMVKSNGALKALNRDAYYGFKDLSTGLEYRHNLVEDAPSSYAAILQYDEERQVYAYNDSKGDLRFVISKDGTQTSFDNIDALWTHIGKEDSLINYAKANKLRFDDLISTKELLQVSL